MIGLLASHGPLNTGERCSPVVGVKSRAEAGAYNLLRRLTGIRTPFCRHVIGLGGAVWWQSPEELRSGKGERHLVWLLSQPWHLLAFRVWLAHRAAASRCMLMWWHRLVGPTMTAYMCRTVFSYTSTRPKVRGERRQVACST
jgi:hypothetical protein